MVMLCDSLFSLLPRRTIGIGDDGARVCFTAALHPPRNPDVPGSARCYPPEKFLAEQVASQGLANTADWNDIDQQVGTLADQIVAKIC